METAQQAAEHWRASQARAEIEDLVQECLLTDALGCLQDMTQDFAPERKREVLLVRARHERWLTDRRTAQPSKENANEIRAAILDLAYEIEGLALGADSQPRAQRRRPEPEMVVSSDALGERASKQASKAKLKLVEARTRRASGSAVMRFDGVTKSFRRGGFRLNDVSFTLNDGEIMGIVGRNASGKTTLLRMMMGELRPDAGKISYPVLEPWTWSSIKRQIAYVPQLPDKWHGNLRHNLNFVAAAHAKRGQDVKELIDWNVARYEMLRFENATWDEISGGYKIRFELIRAIVSQPRLLILDEPLAYLDVIARQRFLRDLRTIASSRESPMPVIITSQHLNEVEAVADQMILLQDGECRYAGSLAGIADLQPDRLLEVSLTSARADIEATLQGFELRRIERTMEGFILAFPKTVDVGQVFQRLRAAYGDGFSAFRDITGSARGLITEDEQ